MMIMGTLASKRTLGTALLLAPLSCLADSSFEVYGFGMVDYVQAFDRPVPADKFGGEKVEQLGVAGASAQLTEVVS